MYKYMVFYGVLQAVAGQEFSYQIRGKKQNEGRLMVITQVLTHSHSMYKKDAFKTRSGYVQNTRLPAVLLYVGT